MHHVTILELSALFHFTKILRNQYLAITINVDDTVNNTGVNNFTVSFKYC